LLALLAAELKTLPNALLIEGHTDAAPYSNDASYSNWELSADRANAARRLLQQDGVRSDQVTQVRGYADQLLRVKANPYDPSNRRISILVKNSEGPAPSLAGSKAVDGSATSSAGKPAAAPTPAGSAAKSDAKPPAPQKAAASAPASKPGLMDRLRGMLPGKGK